MSSSSTCSYEMRASAAVNVDVGEDITYAQRVMKYGMDMNVQVMEFKMENKDGLWVHFYCNNDMNARHAMPHMPEMKIDAYDMDGSATVPYV